MTPLTDLIQNFKNTLIALKCIYEAETQALERIDTTTFLSLQEQKWVSARAYQESVSSLLSRKEELKQADTGTKNMLTQLQADFATLSERNMTALKRMQRTTDRLGNAIRKQAKQIVKQHRAVSYGANGTLKDDNKKRISASMSETA